MPLEYPPSLLEQAQDPTTPPLGLNRLSSLPNRTLRQAVAQNPNTPRPTLEHLARFYPEAVLSNPALEWVRFENPEWFYELETPIQIALLRAENCPRAWLEYVLTDQLMLIWSRRRC
jgi:hypothetical protein